MLANYLPILLSAHQEYLCLTFYLELCLCYLICIRLWFLLACLNLISKIYVDLMVCLQLSLRYLSLNWLLFSQSSKIDAFLLLAFQIVVKHILELLFLRNLERRLVLRTIDISLLLLLAKN